MNNNISDIIKPTRFPLICLVVLAHSPLTTLYPVRWNDFSSSNIYNFVVQGLSFNYARIAVCCFFFFAGLLYFRGMETFSWQWCLKKWKNRVNTLLIPFICWNLLMVAVIALKNLIFGIFGNYNLEEMEIVSLSHILDWFRYPVDFPLWFMEDLIFMVLTTPILYYIIKYLKGWTLILLLLIYASPWCPVHISMRAIFFFSLGAYCSLANFDVLYFCRKYKIPGHILAIVTFLLATFTNTSQCHEWTQRLFYPFGMISLLNIIDAITSSRVSAQNALNKLSASVFFIYAAHEIYILGWTKGICLRVLGESLPAMYIRYFLVPIIVVAVCYGLFRLLNKVVPKALSFMCGGRSVKV